MKIINTKTAEQLKWQYLQKSIAFAKKGTSKLKWTPARWMLYQSRLLRKRETFVDTRIYSSISMAAPKSVILLPDYQYWATNVSDYEAFLAADDTDKYEYVRETYDCDDFAWRLMGQLHHPLYGAFAHGVSWSGTHAYNCFVDWKLQFHLIEPQSDEILTVDEGGIDYYPELVIF